MEKYVVYSSKYTYVSLYACLGALARMRYSKCLKENKKMATQNPCQTKRTSAKMFVKNDVSVQKWKKKSNEEVKRR